MAWQRVLFAGVGSDPRGRKRTLLLSAVIAGAMLLTLIPTAWAASTEATTSPAPLACPPSPPYGGHGFYYYSGYGAPPTVYYPGYYTGYGVPYYQAFHPQGYYWPSYPYYGGMPPAPHW
jgi:hypothetical protein